MSAVVELDHSYKVPARKLWALAIDLDALAEVSKKVVRFTGLPSGQCETGQEIDVKVSLFGLLPAQPYHMTVLECDHDTMTLRSNEQGAGVKRWQHTLTVREDGDTATLHDRIEIDAGVLTPLFARWARHLYSQRHKPRQRLLGLQEGEH
ncbi:hypothetical protein [Actibacterium lipolyticum]|uniref:SRPBCC family protein n=1 Tax=Actibacterium lipolyticum TaxID=1524263 RepID=A0A238JUU0_9RHOB|nr:hypothetical protein [Actibacterium lipolyticum]SMX34253.1 hypothetical protein COL8621_01229 [Actibacterium lipolyticum]